MEGFLLGLGSGTACMAYCYPALIPYILSEGKELRAGYMRLVLFLVGRLIGYIAIGAAAGAVGSLIAPGSAVATFIGTAATLFIALLLILRPLLRRREQRNDECIRKDLTTRSRGFWFPFSLGLFTGLSICPPFLMGITRALVLGSLWHGILFFLLFYTGTLVYFLPLPLAGLLGKKIDIRFIADAAMVIMGIYYLYLGLSGIIPRIL